MTGGAVAASSHEGAAPGLPEAVDPAVPRTLSPYGTHQPGVAAPTPRVSRLVALDLHPDTDRAALGRLMRRWTGTIEAATQGRASPGDTARDLAQGNVDLSVTVGWGNTTIERAGLSRPSCLAEVPAFAHDRLQPSWTGGDLLLLAGAADDTSLTHVIRRLLLDAQPFASLRWEQVGSWRGLDADQAPTTGRNLFGQVDGTANPVPEEAAFAETVWVREPAWLAEGTTLVVRRIRMDLDTWEELTRDEQERSVGRRLGNGAPLGGDAEQDEPDFTLRDAGDRPVIPVNAHIRRAHPSVNGGAQILRRGMNWTEFDARSGNRDAGLLFCSFQADIDAQFNRIQRSLDRDDALNEWTTAIGSAAFAILPGFEQGDWLGSSALA